LKIPIDPARSQCFFLDAGYTVSGIRLNLVGREPQGLLAPGAEADRFCDQLIHDLLDIVHPDSQRPLVKQVLRTAELYRGEYLDELPDLLVEWDMAEPLGTTAAGTGAGAVLKGFSNRVGLVEATNTYCRTGEHRVEGMFVARGPGIRPGRLDRVISNLDLAPTFALLLGCDMPNVDGQPVPELLN
jgi:predicted AlkP superfamily phosphohydrolase/phosphomutase